jgi:hypothetical protein
LAFGCTGVNPAFSLASDETASSTGTSVGDDASTSTSTQTGSQGTAPPDDSSQSGDTTVASTGSGAQSTSGTTRGTEDDSSSTTGDQAKQVFVTSESYTGVEIGGLVGADAKCQSLARAAGIDGVYQAWLSDGTMAPVDRMTKGGPYVLVDGSLVADDWAALVSGAIAHPINITELGEPLISAFICTGGEVWTNTQFDGTRRSTSSCNDWSASEGVSFVGDSDDTDVSWTESQCINVTCAAALPLYCFEQ